MGPPSEGFAAPPVFLPDRKAEACGLAVLRAGPQNSGGKGRLIGGVGVVLRLQAEAVPEAVDRPALALPAILHKVGGVELEPRTVRFHLHGHAGGGAVSPGRRAHGPRLAVDHKVVVVTAAPLQLLEALLYMCADRGGAAQVHGGGLHRLHPSEGDAVLAGGGVGGAEELDILAQHIPAPLTGQVEIAVVGHTAGGVLVSGGLTADGQGGTLQGVGHLHPG